MRARIADHFHCQMRFAVGDAAAHRRADARARPGDRRNPCRARGETRRCRSEARRMASSMTERRPRSSMSRMVKARTPESRTCGFSSLVHVAQAHDDGVARRRPWAGSRTGPTSSGGPMPDDAGQRHAVHVAAGAGFRRVHVGVRVQPDQADAAARLRESSCETPLTVPTATEWSPPSTSGRLPRAERLLHQCGQPLAGGGDLRQVLGVRIASGEASACSTGMLPRSSTVVAQRRQARVQVGHPQRRRGPCPRRGVPARDRAARR